NSVALRERRVAAISLGPVLPLSSMRPTRVVFVVPGQDSTHIWSCCRWGLPCRWCHHQRGALLPHHFTLTWREARSQKPEFRRILTLMTDFSPGGIFLLHFPSDFSAWTLSSTVPCAVRTFLTSSGAEAPLPARS